MKQNEAELAGVAVLGAGVVNPVASTLDDFAKALDAARPRLSRLEGVPVPRGKSLVGLVKEAAFEGSDKAFRMAASAIDQALAASGIDLAAMGEVGVVLATMAGESHAAEKCYTDLAALERVDVQLAGGAGEMREYQHAWILRILRGDEFLGDEVHPVAQRRDQPDAGAAHVAGHRAARDCARDDAER